LLQASHGLFAQARFKDKGSEIASEQLSQVFFAFSVFCLHIVSFAAVLFILLDFFMEKYCKLLSLLFNVLDKQYSGCTVKGILLCLTYT